METGERRADDEAARLRPSSGRESRGRWERSTDECVPGADGSPGLPAHGERPPQGGGTDQSQQGGVFLQAQLGWGGATRKAWGEREGGPPLAPLGRPGPPQQPSSTRVTCSQAWALQRLQPGGKAGSRALWGSSLAWRPHKPVPAAPASGDSRCGWRRAQGRAQSLGSHRHSPPPRAALTPPRPLQGPGHLSGPPAGALAGPLRPGRPGWHQLLSCPEGGPALPCRGEAGVDRGQEAGRPWLSTPPLPGPPGALRLLQQHLGPEPAVPAGAAGGAGPRRQLRGGPGAAALPAAVPAAGHAHPGGQPTLPAARLWLNPPGAYRRAGGNLCASPLAGRGTALPA